MRQRPAAVDHQGRAIGALAELLVEIERAAGRLDRFLTADQYRKLAELLTFMKVNSTYLYT